MTIYSVQVSNGHRTLQPSDVTAWSAALADRNFSPLADRWMYHQCDFLGKRSQRIPNVTKTLGGIEVRADLAGQLLPDTTGLELLPFQMSGEAWLLVNCLNSVEDFDEKRSVVHRSDGGQIYCVLDLVVEENPSLPEMFTLARSNRADVYVRETFKVRAEALSIEGVTFHPMGSGPRQYWSGATGRAS